MIGEDPGTCLDSVLIALWQYSSVWFAQANDDTIYQVTQFENFEPFRRKMTFFDCEETAIRPLIADLDFIPNKTRWGYPFRYGLLEISKKDFELITSKMQIKND